MNKLPLCWRKLISRLLPGRFPQLYSTLDEPLQVPVQVAAYRLALQTCLQPEDRALDVGCGLGYGLEMMSGAARRLVGLDVDERAVQQAQRLKLRIPGLEEVRRYDGQHIPYPDQAFQVVTCVDVIEHVPDYLSLLNEMARVAQRALVVSTPMRRPENTRPDGRPRNVWHLREWSWEEFDAIVRQVNGMQVDWHVLNGAWDGPFQVGQAPAADTLALTPILWRT